MSESRGGFQLGTIGALSLSVVSSVSIVICNKALISTLGFNFGYLVFELNWIGFHVIAMFVVFPFVVVPFAHSLRFKYRLYSSFHFFSC